jgi:hypothetical protein
MALLAHLDAILKAADHLGPGAVKIARQTAKHVKRAAKLAADVTAALDMAAAGAEQFAELARAASSKAREARTIDVKVVSVTPPASKPQNDAQRPPQPGGNRVRVSR